MSKQEKDRPLSEAAKLVHKRINDQLVHLGGLEDRHVKFVTYLVKHHLGFSKFRFELRYLETPKRFIVHVYTADSEELFVRLKQPELVDKIKEYLQLPDWQFEFAKKEVKNENHPEG